MVSGEAARGVANTPYGAAAEGNALSNFNIDWNNQQLQRQESGLGEATNAYQSLIGGGATAAQPAEAALGGHSSAFGTASSAQSEQNKQQQQAQQSMMSSLSGLGGSLGSVLNKGGGSGM